MFEKYQGNATKSETHVLPSTPALGKGGRKTAPPGAEGPPKRQAPEASEPAPVSAAAHPLASLLGNRSRQGSEGIEKAKQLLFPLTDRSKKIRCPSPDHEDRHPSATLYPDGFRCFSCGAFGDVLD